MLLLLSAVLFALPILSISYIISKKIKDTFNPILLMSGIWCLFIILSILFDDSVGFYSLDFSGLLLAYSFLLVINLTVLFVLNIYYSNKTLEISYIDVNNLNSRRLEYVAIILFTLFIVGNILFWNDVNNFIGIRAVIEDSGYFKYLILTDRFDDNSFKYIGRNFTLTGAILMLAYYSSGKKKQYIIMLTVFLLLSLLNIRREPMIIKICSVLIIVFLANRFNGLKIIKSGVWIAIPFAIIFTITTFLLNPDGEFGRILFSYTVGSFPSMQAMLDYQYQSQSDVPLGYTFYFLYSFLKYFDADFAPPSVVLETINSQATNVYTALSYPIIDSGGDYYLLILITSLYAMLIGLIISFSMIYVNNKISIISISIYASVMSLAIRSYMNPAFSHLDLIFAVMYGLILYVVIGPLKVNRIKEITREGDEKIT